jgi:hypothetical protein
MGIHGKPKKGLAGSSKKKSNNKNIKKNMPDDAQPPNEIARPSLASLPSRPITKSKRVLKMLRSQSQIIYT